MRGHRPHRLGPAIAGFKAIAGLPALQGSCSDAHDLTGRSQSRTGAAGGFDVSGNFLAIFEADHSSSPFLLKIASVRIPRHPGHHFYVIPDSRSM